MSQESVRIRARGKFLFSDEKLYIRGVTYGSFRPDRDGVPFPAREIVNDDFSFMVASGINALRVYTVPPRWLLDLAQQHGLLVMVGLPWEQHIAFLDERGRADSIEHRVREGVRACAGHPAVLCYAIGNEIPGSIVRWYGAPRIERFLERLYRAAKAEDPETLVTYVNYPTTEYLQLPFLDFLCFNVYLETQEKLEAYLAKLQNLAHDQPLVMAEVGLDSRRHGEARQAEVLQWQVRAAFASGCAGVFVFSWTDEWHRGGFDVDDWDFGLTRRDRRPKPAVYAVHKAFNQVPFPANVPWPRASVVVCSYNGSRTIAETLEELVRLDYPNYEIIVVDDGSTDNTAAIASQYDVRLIRTENQGLSAARNTGAKAATGEIVAYIDDDAIPDRHWLQYIAHTLRTSEHAGVGGPNIPPLRDGVIADCVASSPGGPVHVLVSDREAEHIPGCNCAFRRDRLQALGGFDPFFRVAGDDVDLCWRMLDRGWTLGFHPGAMVWHHRRKSIRGYWKQQRGYGRAEAMLERKWPHKYNSVGHFAWSGRIYGMGVAQPIRRWRIYHGTWGSAPFQSLYQPANGTLALLPLMPEWYLVNLGLTILVLLGVLWRPLLLVSGPLFAASLGVSLVNLFWNVYAAVLPATAVSRLSRLKFRGLIALLHITQPLARLSGRLYSGLTPWRNRHPLSLFFRRRTLFRIWSEQWRAPEDWLRTLESMLRARQSVVVRGGQFDRWDLKVRGGLLGSAHILTAVEEHGAGRQSLLFRSWSRCCPTAVFLAGFFALLSVVAIIDRAVVAGVMLGAVVVLLAWAVFVDCAGAKTATHDALGQLRREVMPRAERFVPCKAPAQAEVTTKREVRGMGRAAAGGRGLAS